MGYVVGVKGQVVIAREIRQQLGVQPGWLAIQRLVGDHVEVYFVPPEHERSLKGSLRAYLGARVAPGSEWDEARATAWKKAAEDKIGKGEQPA